MWYIHSRERGGTGAVVGNRCCAIGGEEITDHFLYLLVSPPRPARTKLLGEIISNFFRRSSRVMKYIRTSAYPFGASLGDRTIPTTHIWLSPEELCNGF
ncbi:unnamed protein product [Urochloa humidicola]